MTKISGSNYFLKTINILTHNIIKYNLTIQTKNTMKTNLTRKILLFITCVHIVRNVEYGFKFSWISFLQVKKVSFAKPRLLKK